MHGNGDHYQVVRPGKHTAPLLADVNDGGLLTAAAAMEIRATSG